MELPWFAMEYVEGLPITDYCRERACSMDERLRLFRSVCEAVQYAHRQAIIHRDLKPSNILVKADGTMKLLDFGIAKQLQDGGPAGRPNAHCVAPHDAALCVARADSRRFCWEPKAMFIRWGDSV